MTGAIDVLAGAHERIGELGLARPAAFATQDEDPRAFLWWLLRMAGHTHRRLLDPMPAVDPELSRRLEELLARRPAEDAAHGQLHVDAQSVLRRAELVLERLSGSAGPVLAVGDDDGVTLALALLGARDLVAVDVDARLLEWIEASGRALGTSVDVVELDVFGAAVPASLAGECAAVVTDPARSFEDCDAFLRFGAACSRREPAGVLIWVDHPDWNFEHAEVLAALPGLGLACEETIELVHSYPLVPAWLPDPHDKALELGVDPAWLARLFEHTRAWSNAYVLRPAPRR